MRINEIVQSKGSEVVTLSADATVRELVSLLVVRRIGAVVVSSGSQQVAGIVSERDVVRGLAGGSDVLDKPVSAIMTDDVVTVDPHESVDELAKVMTARRVRHVPVVAEGRLQGIVSIGDVVKSRIDELEFERDQLEHYVSGP